MYPTLRELFQDLFGINHFIGFPTFGFMMALSFIAAYFVTKSELKRKESLGLLKPFLKTFKVKPARPAMDMLAAGIIGFVIGFKLLYIALNFGEFSTDPQKYLLTTDGSIVGGLLGALLNLYLRYRELQKLKDQAAEKEVSLWPHQLMDSIVMVAAVAGIIGAKLFHQLENIDDFVADPFGSLFSSGGLTFYGGLICGATGVLYFTHKHKIPALMMIDAAAAGLMLSYGMGRIGCQLSGDGDWGVLNSAYVADASGRPVPDQDSSFNHILMMNEDYYASQFGSVANVPHKYLRGSKILPHWFWAYTYPHNVLRDGIPLENCNGRYCNYLPLPVYPTPMYEAIICLLLFALLWGIRKYIHTPGLLFSIYLLLNGMERFFIEKMRVNTHYHLFGRDITQAEIISFLLILIGLAGIIYLSRKKTA